MPRQKSNETFKEFLNLTDLETKERFYDDYVGRFSKYATLHFVWEFFKLITYLL